jgi:hypothetical protein
MKVTISVNHEGVGMDTVYYVKDIESYLSRLVEAKKQGEGVFERLVERETDELAFNGHLLLMDFFEYKVERMRKYPLLNKDIIESIVSRLEGADKSRIRSLLQDAKGAGVSSELCAIMSWYWGNATDKKLGHLLEETVRAYLLEGVENASNS